MMKVKKNLWRLTVDQINLLAQIFPILGLFGFVISLKTNRGVGLYALMICTFLGFSNSIAGLFLGQVGASSLSYLFSSLILFVCLNIQYFSWHYMYGDSLYNSYFIKLALIAISANCMAFSSSSLGFWIFWTLNNLILVSLMIHKSCWQSAKQSGLLAANTLGMGSVFLGLALFLLSYEISLDAVRLLMVIAALCQSAIWPFNRWLLSSLNSPTPISALMHAGIVNGGGILLVKYNQLFLQDAFSLNLIFALGLITAIVAGFCKLIQTDIKKMLANSTMAQMGFMMMQVGLGLFPAAIAHLCWHGLFKAYLFLNAGSALNAKFHSESMLIKPVHYLWIILATILAVFTFSWSAGLNLNQWDTQWILVGMVAITSFQLSQGLIGKNHIILDMLMVGVCAAIYGFSIHLIELCFDASPVLVPLNALYISGFLALLGLWWILNSKMMRKIKQTRFWQVIYMYALNISQPKANTITAVRSDYRFK